MRIALVTGYYSNATEQAAAATVILAGTGTPSSGEYYAPPSDVEMDADVEVQESKPIGAEHRRLFMRGNQASHLSFKVRPKYATLAAAEAAQIAILSRVGTAGQLVITPSPEETATAALVYPDDVYSSTPPVHVFTASSRVAVIKRIRAKQIGVTVEAQYEIEW